MGLMLGLLLGLSSAPVVAVVVGAIAALLGSIVLPQLPSKSPEGDERRTTIDLRAGALGLACVVGILCGIWLRTHDALSPKKPTLSERLEQWKSIGFSPEEARVLVARSEGLGAEGGAVATTSPVLKNRTILFGDRTTRCAQLSVDRYANVDAAARAYEALDELALARIAHGLSQLSDADARMKALGVVVEASCNGA
ncbi:MAG: hypothetical protein ABI135_08730 [Rhodoferax sp.]